MTFGIKKSSTAAVQFEPHLITSGQKIPTVKKAKVSNILGRGSISGMDLRQIKEELESKFEKYLYEIDRLPLKPLDKIRIVTTYVYSKTKWEFSIYEWVKQHLDNILTCRMRHWLNLHPGANIGHLNQSTSKLGINLSFPSDIFL